ncbi:MAG: TIGR03013 family PEP-CTERM/XrtA system glycosyltransferase [Proteobacteria bacterium]|nr:TIGR03013 family PEP-CTERM/XrtA system glycosyltransferase [Pseudomonadota bacterium]
MPVIFNRYYSARNLSFFVGEGCLMFLSIMLVNWLFKGTVIFSIDIFDCARQAMVVTITFQLCLYFFDLYDLSSSISMPETVTRITQAFGFGCIVLAVIYYLVPDLLISSRVFWTGYLVICLVIFLWRAFYYFVLRKRLFVQAVIVVGTGKLACDIAREVEGKRDSVYKIVGFIGDDEPEFNPNKAPIYSHLEEMGTAVSLQNIERIIVAPDDRRGSTPVQTLLQCKLRGIIVEHGVSFYERIAGRILVERVVPSWIIFSEGFGFSRLKQSIKRAADICLSSMLLVLALPLMLLSAIIIKLESPGPIFYRQERVGQYGISFRLIKLRSMYQDAEKNGAVWASVDDERVTRFGACIRKLRIDELPQLWNVIKGEMSFVGPRPERPVFVEQLVNDIPYYGIRHVIKPGITGWAQVCYPYGASREDALKKLEYDLYYLKNFSVALDFVIIFNTIKTVLGQRGAR